jgi:hypothetical protein
LLSGISAATLRDLLVLHRAGTISKHTAHQAGIPSAIDIEIELRRREAVAA